MVDIIYEDKDLKKLAEGDRKNKYKKYAKIPKFMEGLARVLKTMHYAETIDSFRQFSFLHYEQLKDDMSGYSSVRVVNGMVERIIFTEDDNRIVVHLLELDDSHYGNKK